jgi:hypothetical protein
MSFRKDPSEHKECDRGYGTAPGRYFTSRDTSEDPQSRARSRSILGQNPTRNPTPNPSRNPTPNPSRNPTPNPSRNPSPSREQAPRSQPSYPFREFNQDYRPAQGRYTQELRQHSQTWPNHSDMSEEQPSLDLRNSRRAQPTTRFASHRDHIRAPNYITLGLFRIDPTTPRISLLLSAIRRLSMATGISFWLAVANCFRILLCRGSSWRTFYELVTLYLSGAPILSIIFRYLFLGAGYTDIHHLRLAVHASGYAHSPVIYSTSIPLHLGSTMVWLSWTAFLFIVHHFLCFLHDCLTRPSQQFGHQTDT